MFGSVIFRSLVMAGLLGFSLVYFAGEHLVSVLHPEEYDPWSAYEQMPVQQPMDDGMSPRDKPEPNRPLLDSRRSLGRYPGDEGKNHTRVKSAFKPLAEVAGDAAVTIWCNGKEAVLGTIISTKGEILTKASELSGMIQVQLSNGKKLDAQVVGVARDHDLALLKIDTADKLTPVSWREGATPALGSFLVTVNTTDEPVAIGVLSVTPRKISAPSGLLGILLDQGPSGPVIMNVLPESAAEQAGLKAQDTVLKVNGKPIKSREQLIETISGFRPGDKLTLLIKRKNEELEIIAVLGRPETARPADAPGKGRRTEDERLAGDLSERRGGFPSVLQHDTILRPQQMGGPIVDLDGKTVGINIARADRVSTYALPVKVLLTTVEELKSGKFPAPAELQGDNRARLESRIAALEAELSAADQKIKRAEEELKKAQAAAAELDKQVAKSKTAISERESQAKQARDAKVKADSDLQAARQQLKSLATQK